MVQAVAELIDEASTNVKIDVKLNQACALDIEKLCSQIIPGRAQGMESLMCMITWFDCCVVISCLHIKYTRDHGALTAECVAVLENRQKMWNSIGLVGILIRVSLHHCI